MAPRAMIMTKATTLRDTAKIVGMNQKDMESMMIMDPRVTKKETETGAMAIDKSLKDTNTSQKDMVIDTILKDMATGRNQKDMVIEGTATKVMDTDLRAMVEETDMATEIGNISPNFSVDSDIRATVTDTKTIMVPDTRTNITQGMTTAIGQIMAHTNKISMTITVLQISLLLMKDQI